MRGLLISILVFAVQSLALANEPPVANAGPDANAYTGYRIQLQGTATDAENDPIINWAWSVEQIPEGASWSLLGENTPSPIFTGFTPGDFVLSLVVADQFASSLFDYITIHVADNLPPVAVATSDKATITVGEQVCFDGSQSYDPEEGPLTYMWDFGDYSPLVYDINTCHVFNSFGAFDVTLIVFDERSAFDSNVVTIEVEPPENWPPVANSQNVWCDGSSAVGGHLSATDQDGDPLTFALATPPENGEVVIEPNGAFVYTPNVWDGNDKFGFTATDGNIISNEAFVNLYVFNRPPVADAGRDRYSYTDQTIQLQGTATDAENDPIINWAWSVEQVPEDAAWSLLYESNSSPQFIGFTTGDFVLSLVVADVFGSSLFDYVTIRVVDVNCRIGDLSGNCWVDIEDLDMFCEQWLKDVDCFGQAGCADLIHDYCVDFDDFAELARDWGI
jgi:PKD repeat protein